MATMARLSEPLSREQELAVLETATNGLEKVLSDLKEPSTEGITDASGGNLEWCECCSNALFSCPYYCISDEQ